MANPGESAAAEKIFLCSECKHPLRRLQGKMGPFWGCSTYPDCKHTQNDVDGKPSDDINELYRCPLCTRRMVRASKERGDYWYCSGYNKGCKVTLGDVDGHPQDSCRCQECGNVMIVREGKNGEFWGCKGYPDCRNTMPRLSG